VCGVHHAPAVGIQAGDGPIDHDVHGFFILLLVGDLVEELLLVHIGLLLYKDMQLCRPGTGQF
ncbi:MAG: hypothetical protein WD426_03755, partial [Anditalea sp.]